MKNETTITTNDSSKSDDMFVYEKAEKKSTNRFMQKIKFVDKYVNRQLAHLIVKAVYKTSITPNHLTYISGLLGILAAFFFSRGEYLYFVFGGIAAQLSSIIDGADGMLARAKNAGSDYGAHLDLFLDRILDFFVICGIGVGTYTYYNSNALVSLGFFTAGLYLLQIHLFYLTKSYLKISDKGDTGEARAILYWLILITSLLNRLDLCIYLLLAETVIVNIVRLIIFMRLGSVLPVLTGNGLHHPEQPQPGPQQGNNPAN